MGHIMTVEKIDNWTPEYVAGFTADEVDEAIRKVATQFRTVRKGEARTLIAAAYATNVALKAGHKAAELARKWGKSADEPVAPSSMTLYKRLGICALDLGIDPETEPDAWALLGGKAGANIKVVGEAIEPKSPGKGKDGKPLPAPAATRDGVMQALDVAFTPDGKKRTTAEIDKMLNPDAVEDEPSDDDAADETVGATRSVEAEVKAAANTITSRLDRVGDEQWGDVYKRLALLVEQIDAEVQRRDGLAKAEGTKGKAKKSA